MGKWVNTEVIDSKLIIWVKKASKYDTTYYASEKQHSFCNKLRSEKEVISNCSNNEWTKYIRKYNMTELITELVNLDADKYAEKEIRFA
jgi:hypothetical protein